jgi:CxxC-x17-CxxC domain-containing protein
MSYADKIMTCRDCGTEFVFTSGEQEFYAQKGFTNEPTRCSACRQQRKAGGDRSAGYANGRDSYSSRGDREMHSATCTSCGREAQVPFVPRDDRPVYCSECFQQQRQSYSRGSSRW